MKINEVDPRNYDSDIDYYNALNAKPKQRTVGEPRLSPRQQDAEDEDAISQQRQAAAAKARKERETTWDNKQEGSAPNGQQYNSVYTINAPSKASADSEAYSFKDYHWGAKKVVDQEYSDLGDGRIELKLYVVDNHKYGLWRPWKDSPVYKEGVSEAEEDAFVSKLGGLKSWQVVIRNNYYNGKYSDYSGRYFYVLATSAEEAKQVVLDNADDILQDLLALKSHNGKKILPRGSAVRITPDRIGKIEDGTVAGRMSTTSYRKMYSPQGVMMVKLTNGAISDVQGQEQGVAEGSSGDAFAAGYSAFRSNTTKNPYKPGSEESRQWDLGWETAQSRTWDKDGVAEGAGNISNSIKALYQKIYDAGDDEIEYFYNDSPIFAQYWDEYEGDLDSIIAEVDPKELQIMHDELESYVQQANLAEGFKNSYSVGDRVDSPMGTGTVVALSKNIDIDDKVKVKLDDPSKAGEDGKYKDTFVLTTAMLKHLPEESSKAKNPYAIGMAQAMKSTGDKPPLEKATIRKAHEIAKRVMKQD